MCTRPAGNGVEENALGSLALSVKHLCEEIWQRQVRGTGSALPEWLLAAAVPRSVLEHPTAEQLLPLHCQRLPEGFPIPCVSVQGCDLASLVPPH